MTRRPTDSTNCQFSRCSQPADWAWQPFGPSEDYNCFTTPGSHYRGFPVLKLCDEHKTAIQATLTNPDADIADIIVFNQRHVGYILEHGKIQEGPF